MKIFIEVKLQLEGLHCWPEAKDVFPEVSFLSDLHRHIFYISCKLQVTHSDRDKEFILFKREVENYLKERYFSVNRNCLVFGRMSCEDIAVELINKFNLQECKVYEDNENGAIVINESQN